MVSQNLPVRPTGTGPLNPQTAPPVTRPAPSPPSQNAPALNLKNDINVQQRPGTVTAPNSLNFPDNDEPQIQVGPSRDEILQGKVLEINQTSDAMPELRRKLSQLGMDPGEAKSVDALHSESTAQQVFNFRYQSLRASGQSAEDAERALQAQPDPTAIDATTLRSIEGATAPPAPTSPSNPTPTTGSPDLGRYDPAAGARVLRAAEGRLRDGETTGRCYFDVKRAVNSVYGEILTGASAYMAGNQLAASPHFEEVTGTQAQLRERLGNLPEGAIVVWDRSPNAAMRRARPRTGWAHGHISVADGRGNEISDHRTRQLNPHYAGGNVRIFLPTGQPGQSAPTPSS